MAYKKYGKGWFRESKRHSLARQGVKTGRKTNYSLNINYNTKYTAGDTVAGQIIPGNKVRADITGDIIKLDKEEMKGLSVGDKVTLTFGGPDRVSDIEKEEVNYAYTASDLPGIVTTGVGTAGAEVVGWIPLLVALGVTKKVIKDIKKAREKKKKINYAIKLVDVSKHKFGSVQWQNAMLHNVTEKLKHKEKLSVFEEVFLDTQKEHVKKVKNYAKEFKPLKYKGKTVIFRKVDRGYGDEIMATEGGEFDFIAIGKTKDEAFNLYKKMADTGYSKVNYQQVTYEPITTTTEKRKLEPGWVGRGLKREAEVAGKVAKGVGKVGKGIFGTIITGLRWEPETEKVYYGKIKRKKYRYPTKKEIKVLRKRAIRATSLFER